MESAILDFVDVLVREGAPVDDGVRLPTERRLAELTGLSRSQVRERLSGLQALGMLQKVQGSGNILRAPGGRSDGNVFELMLRARLVTVSQIAQAREMLEIAIAPRILDHVTEAHIVRLEEHVYAMVDASADRDLRTGLEADHAFHLALFDLLDNPIMSFVVNGMNQALRDLVLERRRIAMGIEIVQNGGRPPEMFRNDAVHFQITRALRSRRRDAVTAAMVEHFDQWRRIARSRPVPPPADTAPSPVAAPPPADTAPSPVAAPPPATARQ